MIFSLRKHPVTVALVGITLLALVLRLIGMDSHGLWYDEIASIETAQRGVAALLTDRFGWMHVQTPLHYGLVWLTIQPFDPVLSTWLVRLPSLLAGTLTPLLVYGVGRELFGRIQGLFAALLVAVSSIHIVYAQDARPYELMIFLSTLSVYCLLMAQRTGLRGWWAAFAVTSIVNVLNSYTVLTTFLPALAPYLLWLFYRLWRARKGSRAFLYATLSFASIAAVSLAMLADMSLVPRTPPRISWGLLDGAANVVPEFATWFTQLGIGGLTEHRLAFFLFLFAPIGFYFGLRRGGPARSGAALCMLFLVVPAYVLHVLSTSNTVFQKYAFASMPFYLLLIVNGIVSLGEVVGRAGAEASVRRLVRGTSLALGSATFLLSCAGVPSVYNFSSPAATISRPDYRGVSSYISAHANPQDTAAFVLFGDIDSTFYWHAKPPIPTYNILDPGLYSHGVGGSIYWVVSYLYTSSPRLALGPGWSEAAQLDGALILKESGPNIDVADSFDKLSAMLRKEASLDEYVDRAARILHACAYRARGDSMGAARAYDEAGTLFIIGNEYLQTSEDFAERGDIPKAWREALVSENMQPNDPRIHRWLASMLVTKGMEDQSRIEAGIADALQVAH